jgi:hypothetical protein
MYDEQLKKNKNIMAHLTLGINNRLKIIPHTSSKVCLFKIWQLIFLLSMTVVAKPISRLMFRNPNEKTIFQIRSKVWIRTFFGRLRLLERIRALINDHISTYLVRVKATNTGNLCYYTFWFMNTDTYTF